MTAAILAVLAGLSSLYGNRLAEGMLASGNAALLDQTRAADTWNEYESQSIKKHLASELTLVTSDSAHKRTLTAHQHTYAAREKPLGIEASRLERERDLAMERTDRLEQQKLRFDVAVALFQISIVLASIAALTKRTPLFIVGIIGGLAGLVFCVLGLLH